MLLLNNSSVSTNLRPFRAVKGHTTPSQARYNCNMTGMPFQGSKWALYSWEIHLLGPILYTYLGFQQLKYRCIFVDTSTCKHLLFQS